MANTKRLNYALDIYGNKYYNYYFEPDKKLKEEIKYQSILEDITGYKIYLNPKTKEQGVRTPDYWFEDTNELWDLKYINGNNRSTIDAILRKSKNQSNNIILVPNKTKMSIDTIANILQSVINKHQRMNIKKIILIDNGNKKYLLFTR